MPTTNTLKCTTHPQTVPTNSHPHVQPTQAQQQRGSFNGLPTNKLPANSLPTLIADVPKPQLPDTSQPQSKSIKQKRCSKSTEQKRFMTPSQQEFPSMAAYERLMMIKPQRTDRSEPQFESLQQQPLLTPAEQQDLDLTASCHRINSPFSNMTSVQKTPEKIARFNSPNKKIYEMFTITNDSLKDGSYQLTKTTDRYKMGQYLAEFRIPFSTDESYREDSTIFTAISPDSSLFYLIAPTPGFCRCIDYDKDSKRLHWPPTTGGWDTITQLRDGTVIAKTALYYGWTADVALNAFEQANVGSKVAQHIRTTLGYTQNT